MKKILILGINGFIGHHLSRRILDTTDWDVYGMDMQTDRIADLLPFSTSSFIATYVLSMAAAVLLLRPPLRYGATVALVACVAVLLFTGALVAWIAAVTGASLLYTRGLMERVRAR